MYSCPLAFLGEESQSYTPPSLASVFLEMHESLMKTTAAFPERLDTSLSPLHIT